MAGGEGSGALVSCDTLADISAVLRPCVGPWAGVVRCESGGDMQALNNSDTNGRSSHGGWQFQLQTWDWIASLAGWDHLVGVDPRWQPVSVQMAMADQLRVTGGLGHWPNCGQFYGSLITSADPYLRTHDAN